MVNTVNIPRTHVILGFCLPLAVLVGYFLAEPLEIGSVAVIALVLAILCVPLLMKWHHPLLVLSWNAVINPFFLPGRPYLWMVMAFASLFFAALNRSVNPFRRFQYVPAVSLALVFLTAVVVVTAFLTGGIGLASLRSGVYGGRSYFYVLAAVAGYFALTSQRISLHRVGVYLAMFFLPGVVALVANLAYAAGPKFFFVFDLFPPEIAMEQAAADYTPTQVISRIYGLSFAGAAVYAYLLARHGITGLLDLTRPWRLLFFLLATAAFLTCGFRSTFALFAVTVAAVFWLEGLWRTSLLPALAGVLVVAAILVLPWVEQLPLAAQRTLSFLPVKVDPLVRQSAASSTEWRVEMWKVALPMVPQYLLKGKGYALNPDDLFLAQESTARRLNANYTTALMAGDYHNGPLSVIIPFGLFGAAAFLWFLGASLRLLYHYYRNGDPALHRTNTFLLAAFASKALFFFVAFGALSSDLFIFTGLIGISVSLNGPPGAPEAEPTPEPVWSFFSARI